MSGDIVERLRNWDDGRVSTHYEGCWDSHPVCAILLAADAIEARDAEIERLRKRLQACQSIDALPLTDDCITQNERMLFTENERLRAERDDLHVLLRGRTAELQAEIGGLRGNQRAVVALARTVLGKSEHPVERSPWIDVIHMMDEEARTNGSASATNAGGPT